MNLTLTPEEITGLGAAMGHKHSGHWAITLAYKLRIWETIGYPSWEEYLAGEHWELEQKPTPENTSNEIKHWASYGMSAEAISRITSLDITTITAELATSTK